MASTRWLLLLMLWLLSWLQMVKSEFLIQKFASVRNWDSVVIPKDGVYLISVIADPCKRCVLHLHVYCQCQGKETYVFTAYANDIYSHAEVAAGLKKNDKLFLKKYGKTEAGTSFAVVYVAELNSFYITVRNDLSTGKSPVTYTSQLTPNGGWRELNNADKRSTFNIPTAGMYWVTSRPTLSSPSVYMTVRLGSKDLFVVYAEGKKAISASGAFYFTAGSTILTVKRGGTYEPQTLLSVVYLAGNKKTNTYPFEHFAFTATSRFKSSVEAKEVLQFKHVLTDYGYMYIDGYTEIRRTGSYIVSIRPDPESASLVIVNFYLNGKLYWVIYAEEGVPVGATISIFLKVGSYLEVRSDKATTLGDGAMFSIAFLQPF